jgi:hypothetical protein
MHINVQLSTGTSGGDVYLSTRIIVVFFFDKGNGPSSALIDAYGFFINLL